MNEKRKKETKTEKNDVCVCVCVCWGEGGWSRSYSETVRAKLFCCAFKLAFLQLICKAFLIFKSNLELALSIILKQKES